MRALTSSKPATEASIAALEAQLRAVLPRDVKRYFLFENGGRLREEMEFAVPGIGPVPLVDLLSVGVGGRDDLGFQHARLRGSLPEHTIPLGSDPAGNFICVDLTSGAVLFWDHEYSTPDEEEGEEDFNMPLLAESFGEFLQSLQPIAGE